MFSFEYCLILLNSYFEEHQRAAVSEREALIFYLWDLESILARLYVLVTYHCDVVGCFIWDLFKTSWKCTHTTSLLRSLETWWRHFNKMSWRRTTETSWQRYIETFYHWVFHLRHTCDVTERYRETLLQHCHDVLLPGGMSDNIFYVI